MVRNLLSLSVALGLCLIWASPVTFALTVDLGNSPTSLALEDQSSTELVVRLDIGQISVETISARTGLFSLLAIEGFGQSLRIGEPSLPVSSKLISIPYGCDLKTEVISSQSEEISLRDLGISDPLIPVQPSLSKSDDPMSVPFEHDQTVYERSGWYQLPAATAEVIGMMRGVRLGRLAIAPVEYNPTEGLIRVYTQMTVRVTFSGSDWAATKAGFNRVYSPAFDVAYNKIFNYQGQLSNEKDDLVTYPVKYLIISDRMFEAQLQEFIDWKTQKGFVVVVAYTDVIGSSNTVISSYIEDMYNAGTPADPAPSFVLFVGDAQQIPPFAGLAGSHITDLYFCEFTGDGIPEIYYGRFSAQNTGALQPQIDKTLEYEKYLMPDPSYLERVTLIAGVDGTFAPTHGNGQINYGTQNYFNAAHGIASNTWLYPASDASGASAAIIAEISEGVSVYNYTAHCNHEGHADPNFVRSHIPGLTNYHKYVLGIGNCCLPNTFGLDYSTNCFGEDFLQLPERGAIGYVGATDNTYWDEDYWFGVGYGSVVGSGPSYEATGPGAYDGLFHDHGEPTSMHYVTNGSIQVSGNLAVTESGSSRTLYYWEEYHLMGDPSVMTYIGIPSTNNIVHEPAILMTASSMLVQADPGSYVGISIDGALQGAGYVDASGSVEVNLAGFSAPGEADIVISCQNRIPYMSTVQVITPSGPYVIFDYYDIDDAIGNSNGLAEPGETIVLGMQLENVGPDDAVDVTGVISSTDPYVTITDNTEAFGTVLANGGTANVASAYSIDVSSDAPDGHYLEFDLEVTGTTRETWNGSFRVQVHAPVISYLTVSIADPSGNANGKLDPGETADVAVTLGNSGSGRAVAVTGFLISGDANVLVSGPSGTFGDLDSINGTANNNSDQFTVSADGDCPTGSMVSMELQLTGDNGFAATVNFPITVGDRVVFFFDDFSSDMGWTGY